MAEFKIKKGGFLLFHDNERREVIPFALLRKAIFSVEWMGKSKNYTLNISTNGTNKVYTGEYTEGGDLYKDLIRNLFRSNELE